MKRLWIVVVSLTLLALFLHAINREPVLRVGIHTFPANLNPAFATDETSQAVVNKIYDSLFTFDTRGELIDGLVESYRYMSDTEVELRVRSKVFFANGRELTASDAAATLEVLLDDRYHYPYASALGFIKSLRAIDRYRLVLKTQKPIATWRYNLTFKIMCGQELSQTKPSEFREACFSGTGPYALDRCEPPYRVVLKRNPYNSATNLYPEIHYTVVAYPNLMPLKLLNREIDVCELQPEDIPVYRENQSWRQHFDILKYRKFGYTYLVFNSKNKAITRPFRQQLYNALVSGDFIAKFLQDRGEPVKSPFMLLDSKVDAAPFATEKISPPLRLKILTNSESQMRKRCVLFMKQALKPIGVELEPVFLEYHSFLGCLKRKDFDLALSGFVLDIDYDMRDVLASDGYFNYAGFMSDEMDRLLASGLRELDPQRREAIYLEAHNLWKRHLPILPLFNLYYYVGVSKGVQIPTATCRLMGSNGDFLQNIRDWVMVAGR